MIGAAWAVEVALIFVRDLGGNTPGGDTSFSRRPPYPWELLSSAVIFGALLVISQNETARRPAAAVAWGLVVATFIGGQEAFSAPKGNAALDALGTVSRFLSGGYAPAQVKP
jgi:hypothetical protein